jgi:hypothetical protein
MEIILGILAILFVIGLVIGIIRLLVQVIVFIVAVHVVRVVGSHSSCRVVAFLVFRPILGNVILGKESEENIP